MKLGTHSTYVPNYVFCVISPEPNMITQKRWCLPLCSDAQGLQWYHIQQLKLNYIFKCNQI